MVIVGCAGGAEKSVIVHFWRPFFGPQFMHIVLYAIVLGEATFG